MEKQSGSAGRIVMILIAVIAWGGLVIQFYVTFTHPNLAENTPGERISRFFDFFTILTNLLVAVSLTISLLLPQTELGRFFSSNNVQSAIALYIVLVGVTYNILLRGTHATEGGLRSRQMRSRTSSFHCCMPFTGFSLSQKAA